jgi:uncharacterized cupredoxin-like copper-binding protein
MEHMFSCWQASKVFQVWYVLSMFALFAFLMIACAMNSSHVVQSDIRQVRIIEDDFRITSSLTTFTPGVPYRFTIKNTGHTMHEFMITPLTLSTMNGMSMSDMDQLSLADVRNIAPGQIRTLTYTFPLTTPGTRLQFACHYPGHYQSGMRLNVIVLR